MDAGQKTEVQMNRQNPYTQRQIERAIRAALATGLRVIGVRPDGTVLTEMPESTPNFSAARRPGLRDARDKLPLGPSAPPGSIEGNR